MKLKYFKISDFESPDAPGSGELMKASTLKMLDQVRAKAGIPIIPTSGYRTLEHNERVGGVNGSSHTKGYAVDIRCWSSSDRDKILKAARAAGFNRIGIAKRFIHLDNDPDKPPHKTWLY